MYFSGQRSEVKAASCAGGRLLIAAISKVIKCETKAERWLPFEKGNNGPKMFCLPHGHKEHKPVHKITGTDVHFQVLWTGKDG